MFFRYFEAATRAPRHRMKAGDFIAVYIIFLVNFIYGMDFTSEGFSIIIAFLCAFVLFAGISMGNTYNRQPNIASLMPLSKRQNIAYRFLAAIFMFVIITVMVALVFFVIALLSFLIFVLPNGVDVNYDGTEEVTREIFENVGVYGGIFSACYFVMMYSAGIISGFFKRRKRRNIYLLCVCGAVLLSFILMSLPYSVNPSRRSTFFGNRISPFVNACFEAMKLPQLCIAIWCVLAAASLAAAVYLSVKQYNKSSSV